MHAQCHEAIMWLYIASSVTTLLWARGTLFRCYQEVTLGHMHAFDSGMTLATLCDVTVHTDTLGGQCQNIFATIVNVPYATKDQCTRLPCQ